ARARTSLQHELARYRADELAATAELMGSASVVLSIVEADATDLKQIAVAIAAKPGHIVAAVSRSRPVLVVVARADGVPLSAQQVIGLLVAKFGGRGGGRAELAQGGGLTGSPEEILAAARALLIASLPDSH